MSADALILKAMESGVEVRLVDGKIKLIGKHEAVNRMIEPLRRYKAEMLDWLQAANDPAPEPPADPNAWRELAQAYHQHHLNCKTCIAAGRGARYGLRCGTGQTLWHFYQTN